MLNRENELDAFKRDIDLSVFAASYGFEVDRQRTTRHCVMMRRGGDKIAISNNGRHFIFWDVNDRQNNGSIVDLCQNTIEPGCSLGRVRQLCRPFLNSSYLETVRQQYAGRYAAEIKPSQTDLLAVAANYARFVPIAHPHDFLCDVRGIPFELLQSERLQNRVKHCPRRGSIVYPHYGCPTGTGSADRSLVGYEIHGKGVKMYSKGGRKGLFASAGFSGDTKLAVAESGLDALSYLALHNDGKTRVVSTGGKFNPSQPALLEATFAHLGQGQIIAAVDNDKAGDEITQELAALVKRSGNSDLTFIDHRAPKRGADWNAMLMEETHGKQNVLSLRPQFGR